ncbi:MAG: hypothetical protein ABSB42_04515 [Tepidisphaeraceae bacterium]|jgi:hypothetical protein
MPIRVEPTKEELIERLDAFLFGWGFKDIGRASKGGSKLGAFILAACFIDAMAGFSAGINRSESKHGSTKRFVEFVAKYLPQYNATKIWEDLRCGLVHAYAEGGSYSFTASNPRVHGMSNGGKVVLNLEDFLSDVECAYSQLRADILADKNEAFRKAKRRLSSMGLMGPGNPMADVSAQ